jgi:hypothetical protein
MNWRRGLFRLWIVGATLFVLAVAAVSYDEIKTEFNAVTLQRHIEASGDEIVVPALCGKARGVAGVDYTTKKEQQPGPWDRFARPNSFDNCWYALSKFRLLYPEYSDLADKELTRKLYATHGELIRELPNPWATLGVAATIALGVPFTILALGASLLWAFSGFSTRQKP